MILFDFSQIVISSALSYHSQSKEDVTIEILRHLALNSILSIKSKLNSYSEEVVLCLDARTYWRKEVFPNYKKHRKKNRDDSKFNWDVFFVAFNQLKEEFKEHSPFKVVEVTNAEADDIIATLSLQYGHDKDIVIVSSDNDFLQLQSLRPRVTQWSTSHKDFITIENSNYDLFEHIIKGDAGDGIPNILSEDDVFLTDKRSKPIRAVKIEEWRANGLHHPEEYCQSIEEIAKVKRNQLLIDLTMIPEEIATDVISVYDNTKSNRNKTFAYLVKHQLMKIMKDAQW